MSGRTGTREWSSHSDNIQTGCEHDCRYCYAAARMHQLGIRERDKWRIPEIRERDVNRGRKKRDGVIMFPTSHDITPRNLGECLFVIEKLLTAFNDVLVVMKPHRECVYRLRALVESRRAWREHLELRLTITAGDSEEERKRTAYWEPGAPGFDERMACLRMAADIGARDEFRRPMRVSVAIEPALYLPGVPELVERLSPLVTETIWVGLMRHVRRRVRIEIAEDEERVREIEAEQRPEKVREIYGQLRDHPKVHWKDSIRKLLTLSE